MPRTGLSVLDRVPWWGSLLLGVVGVVVAPAQPGEEPLPVIAWVHGTTGSARTCAPSVLKDPFGAGAFFALDQVIDHGWALVATDYIGLGTEGLHPYLIGQGEARSVLDAVRAAHQVEAVDLADQTIVWGHSQGGHAALWTGMLAPTYAPDAMFEASPRSPPPATSSGW